MEGREKVINKEEEEIEELRKHLGALKVRSLVPKNAGSHSRVEIGLVLDINGFLLSRKFLGSSSVQARRNRSYRENAGSPRETVRVGNFEVFFRPGMKEFIRFVLENFEVFVWSSAQRRNIEMLLDHIFTEEEKAKLIKVFDQSHCTIKQGSHPDRKGKPLLLKDLRKVWENCPQFSPENTLLIDDSPYKTALNPQDTAIHPEEWKCEMASDSGLTEKGDIYRYLVALRHAADQEDWKGVPDFVRNNPFPILDSI